MKAKTELVVHRVGQTGSINLKLTKLFEAGSGIGENIKNKDPLSFLQEFIVPFGVAGKKAIGGILYTQVRGLDDPNDDPATIIPVQTFASIGSGARCTLARTAG